MFVLLKLHALIHVLLTDNSIQIFILISDIACRVHAKAEIHGHLRLTRPVPQPLPCNISKSFILFKSWSFFKLIDAYCKMTGIWPHSQTFTISTL